MRGFGEVLALAAAFLGPSPLARIRMAVEPGHLAHYDEWGELLDRLDGVPDAPWPALRAAVIEIREFEDPPNVQ